MQVELIPPEPLAARIKWAVANALTQAAAFAIGRFRDIQQDELTDDECDQLGLPYGSTTPAVIVGPLGGMPWWRFAVWNDGEGCFMISTLGHHGEIYFHRKGHPEEHRQ